MSLKKHLVKAGATLSLATVFAVANQAEADASTWTARSAEQIEADIQSQVSAQNGQETVKYTVKWGDTLGEISKATNVSVEKLANVNEINNVNQIVAGNVLYLSGNNNVVSVEDENHNVKSYDISEEEVRETETPVEVEEQVQAEAQAQQQAQAEQEAQARAQAEQEAQAQAQAQQQAQTQSQSTSQSPNPSAGHSTSEAQAKEIIAQRESNGSYEAVNPTGKYIGRYQLDRSYLGGDHSPANQERVVENYVAQRYGSWNNALAFWNQNGWY